MESDAVSVAVHPPAPPIAPTPLALYQLAIERGVDAAELGKLLDLHERMVATAAKAAFDAAMNACQDDMPTVVRTKKNTQTGKNYAPVEEIQSTAKPIYSRHGFSIVFDTDPGTAPELTTMHLDLAHKGGHTKRVTLTNVPLDDKGPKGGDVKTKIQGLKSSMSYAKGILICMAFNITVADEDDDGQFGSYITKEQIGEVNDAIQKLQATGHPFKLANFLNWLNIEALDKMAQRDLHKALTELKNKTAAAEKKNATATG